MAIQDNNPERRNLSISSLAFIVYFFAGGELADDVVRVQLVNIKFTHPELLGVLAWLMVFWFAYRYWLIHSGNFRLELNKELQRWSSKEFIRRYIGNVVNEPVLEDPEEGLHIRNLGVSGNTVTAVLFYAKSVGRGAETGEVSSYSDANKKEAPGQVEFVGLKGRIVSIRLLAECFVVQPSFSSYIVPYILFAIAVVGGITNAL